MPTNRRTYCIRRELLVKFRSGPESKSLDVHTIDTRGMAAWIRRHLCSVEKAHVLREIETRLQDCMDKSASGGLVDAEK